MMSWLCNGALFLSALKFESVQVWPVAVAAKQVLFLDEIEEILKMTPQIQFRRMQDHRMLFPDSLLSSKDMERST